MIQISQILVKRLIINYRLLNSLYKQGKFEEEVSRTANIKEENKFYEITADKLANKQKFESDFTELHSLGKKRNALDLQWATSNLREQAQHLFENYQETTDLSPILIKSIIIYYHRIISLSYEVDDYFLSTTENTSNFLITLTNQITDNVENYLSQFDANCSSSSKNYLELTKQVLIVALCGTNQLYRKHQYKEGLEKAKVIKQQVKNYSLQFDELKERWFGLKGLCAYVAGKIYTALSDYPRAEEEFRYSVEAYSESIWQKEQLFSKSLKEIEGLEHTYQNRQINRENYEKVIEMFPARKQEHELSRAVALRRCGLASSFGYAFQSLVMGQVKDSIRVSSLARGIVNWNTGKIYSSYVDLIYYSAKRAENSSDIDALVEIRRKLKRCYRVFQDLIPAAHYKYRALFQISLVYHYIARWHKERGLMLTDNTLQCKKERLKHLKIARNYWQRITKRMQAVINDKRILPNKRLRAESMAILGHAWSNLALLEHHLGGDGNGLEMLEKALLVLENAENEASEHTQIKCEVGLARAAVGKAQVEFILRHSSTGYILDETDEHTYPPQRKEEFNKIRSILNVSRQMLLNVLTMNQNNSIRIQATAYLRLSELAFMQKATWTQSHEYYNEFKKISSKVEHEFCHKWARDLEEKIIVAKNSFTFTLAPGAKFYKEEFENKLNQYYADYAVNHAANNIELDYVNKRINNRSSLSSYLFSVLEYSFGMDYKAAKKLFKNFNMFERVRQISEAAKTLKEYGKQGRD